PWQLVWGPWFGRASEFVQTWRPPRLQPRDLLTVKFVKECRAWSSSQGEKAPITAAYGGHYFSPVQSIWVDAFRATLPSKDPLRTLALASLIRASSKCVASPGHTAQPFQPTKTAKAYLRESWSRDLV